MTVTRRSASRTRRGMRLSRTLLAALGVGGSASLQAQNPQDVFKNQGSREAIEKLLNAETYGVPATPAFELLPGKPSEVVSLLTPKDLGGQIRSWSDGKSIRIGAGFELRPFANGAGSLTEYQKSAVKQVWWRTVFAAGTAAATDQPKDVIVAAGLRLPLIDKGDPRGNSEHMARLETVYRKAFDAALRAKIAPDTVPDPMKGSEFYRSIDSIADIAGDTVRSEFAARTWNAFKLDVGIAGSIRALNGIAAVDSVQPAQGGFWAATAFPTPGLPAQVTLSAKLVSVDADSTGAERLRFIGGGRVQLLSTGTWTISGEAARIAARYRGDQSLDETWSHYAVVLELPSPLGDGWLGIAYGGDTEHRTQATRQIAFQYALYKNRVLPLPGQ